MWAASSLIALVFASPGAPLHEQVTVAEQRYEQAVHQRVLSDDPSANALRQAIERCGRGRDRRLAEGVCSDGRVHVHGNREGHGILPIRVPDQSRRRRAFTAMGVG